MESTDVPWIPIPRAKVRLWVHNRDVEKLRKMVLEGQGSRLLGETAPTAVVRQFLEGVPQLMKLMRNTHEAAVGGHLVYFLREVIPVDVLLSRDSTGRTILHKAVGFGHEELVRYLLANAPSLVSLKDIDGRCPTHFCGLLTRKDKRTSMFNMLIRSGADPVAEDKYGKRPEFYINNPKVISSDGLGEIPEAPRPHGNRPALRKASSLPPVGTLVRQIYLTTEKKDKRRPNLGQVRLKPLQAGASDPSSVPSSIPLKENNRLMRSLVLLLSEGRTQTLAGIRSDSRHYSPEDFVRDIPLHKERIDGLHSASSRGKLSRIRAIVDSFGSVPALNDCTDLFAMSKNPAKATALHLAAVNGHVEAVQYLLSVAPEALHHVDMDGRTPLHYAALGRNRENCISMYQMLKNAGANVSVKDKAGRVAKDYIQFDENVIIDNDNGDVMVSLGANVFTDSARSQRHMVTSRGSDFEQFRSKPEDFPIETMEYDIKNIKREKSGMQNLVSPSWEKNAFGDPGEAHREERRETDVYSHDDDLPLIADELDDIYNQRYPHPIRTDIRLPVIEEMPTPSTDADERKPKLPSFSSRERQSIDSYEEHERAFSNENNADLDQDMDDIEEISNLESNSGKELGNPVNKLLNVVQHQEQDRESVADWVNSQTNRGQRMIQGNVSDLKGKVKAYSDEMTDSFQEKKIEVKEGIAKAQTHVTEIVEEHITDIKTTGNNVVQGFGDVVKGLDMCNNVNDGIEKARLGVEQVIEENIVEVKARRSEIMEGNRDAVKEKMKEYSDGVLKMIENGNVQIRDEIDKVKNGSIAAGTSLKNEINTNITNGLSSTATAIDSVTKTALRPLERTKTFSDIYESISKLPTWATPAPAEPKEEKNEAPKEDIEEKRDVWKRMDDFWFGRNPKNKPELLNGHAQKSRRFSEIFAKDTPVTSPAPEPTRNNRRGSFRNLLKLERIRKRSQQFERDENGNTELHFAAKTDSRDVNELLKRLAGTTAISARNEDYMTPRDVAVASGNDEAVLSIDAFVIDLCKKGKVDQLNKLFVEGYDHFTDIFDPATGESILTVTEQEGPGKSVKFLRGLIAVEELRDTLHSSIRLGELSRMKDLLKSKGRVFAVAKDKRGRCSLHIATLAMHPYKLEMASYLCKNYPQAVTIQDNLGRTALHYAYGLGEDGEAAEVAKVIEGVGAKTTVKDWHGRTPTDFLALQSEIYQLAKEEQMN